MINTMRIAYRNMSRQKKRSLLLGGAIMFGVLIITMLNGFTAGLSGNMKENFSQAFGGHIFISGSEVTESGKTIGVIRDDKILKEVIDPLSDEIRYINKRSRATGSIIFGTKELILRIEGIDREAEGEFASTLSINNPRAIILPAPIADKLGVEIGETLLARFATVTGQQNVGEFELVAVIEDQASFGISAAYTSIEYLNMLLGIGPDEFLVFHIFLNNLESMDITADNIYTELSLRAETETRQADVTEADAGNQASGMMKMMQSAIMGFGPGNGNGESWEGTRYSIITLNDMMDQVMSMVSLLDTIGLVIFIILLVITMVGITNTFRMIMLERTREIGTIRAIGMQRNSVRNIFLLEALFIAFGGAVCGVAAAGILMALISVIPMESVEMFQFFLNKGKLSFAVLPRDMGLNILILSLMSLFAAWFPARKASRLEPALALRTQY